MKTRLSVARCCCVNFCEDCCNGNIPTEWEVDVQFGDSDCTICDDFMSGVYTLNQNFSLCEWVFDESLDSLLSRGESCSPGYDPMYGYDAIRRRRLELSVKCLDETQYTVRALVSTERWYSSGTEYLRQFGVPVATTTRLGLFGDIVEYKTTIDYDEFTCDETVDFELPFSSIDMVRQWRYSAPPFGFDTQVEFIIRKTTLPIGQVLSSATDWYTRPICEPPATIKITGVP